VDLTDDDVKRSVSRRHAKLIHSNGQFYVVEEVGTLNGTFISGKRIPTGILTPLKSGAHVGFGTLRLKFLEKTHTKE
jgi:pSer/pThr/pTyr-binding forkhead associated (FHA) protein